MLKEIGDDECRIMLCDHRPPFLLKAVRGGRLLPHRQLVVLLLIRRDPQGYS